MPDPGFDIPKLHAWSVIAESPRPGACPMCAEAVLRGLASRLEKGEDVMPAIEALLSLAGFKIGRSEDRG